MGLDMYIYRVTRLNEQESKDIESIGYNELCDIDSYHVHEYDNNAGLLLWPIQDYVTFIEKPVEYLDFEIGKKICGIPQDAKYYGQIFNSGVYFFQINDGEKTYEINFPKLSKKKQKQMTFTKNVTLAIYKAFEEFYWRKNYDLQNAIHKACDTKIENCGYYPLNDKMKQCIIKACKDDYRFNAALLEPTENSIVCYHEWY